MDKKKTIGLVYHSDYLIHSNDFHPERKERLKIILSALEVEQLSRMTRILKPEPATKKHLALVHDPNYIKHIELLCLKGQKYLDMDTYLVPRSYEVALLSAGGALKGLQEIWEGELKKVFVLSRPPGHHAERARGMGFCLFNNAAIAAAEAARVYGLKRIAIMDWDVHHGNGIQQVFEEDSRVLYLSIHQSPAFPGTGALEEAGKGKGEGYNVNIPLPGGSGDADYALFIENVVVPVLEVYQPELLIVSAGQDGYYKDPLAGMELTCKGYFAMAASLAKIAEKFCRGRMLLCLEGGYHLKGLMGSVIQILNAIGNWGLPVPEEIPSLQPSAQARQRLREIINFQRTYWPI